MAFAGAVRWRHAVPEEGQASRPSLAAPPPMRAAAVARLGTASETVARGNPFRLDRSPAPLGSPAPGQLGMMMSTGYPPGGTGLGGAYPAYVPPVMTQQGGALRVTGISGPPWEALVEGIPGKQGAVVVRPGDRVEDLRIRSISQDLVVVQGRDTTWRLQIKRTGQ
jgi:hypothetical protein